jgi:pimeloyl-ACP methyl ester carboxylesterase
VATFIVAHGAWSAGWVWKKMHPLMRAKGHELITPTYTGLGERVHLATSSIGLETHIQDMLMVLQMEDVRDAILIGHSYGGMVATGVADLAAERISKLVYLDAFVPAHGKSVFDLVPPEERERRLAGVVDGWRLPPPPPPPDTSPRDVDWITPRRVHQPLACFQEPLLLENGEPRMPRFYIYAQRHNPGDPFRQFLERAKKEGWPTFEMDVSHSPHVTAPDALADILDQIAKS